MEFTDEEIGEIKIIKNFLPPPEQLVFKQKTEKITLSLNSSTIYFFKEQADLHHGQYQKMIRALLDEYAMRCMITEQKKVIRQKLARKRERKRTTRGT